MNPLLLGGLIGGGTGLLKGLLFDGPQEAKQRQLQSATARFSPWTGLKPEAVKPTNLMGEVMQGGASGAVLGQDIQSAQNADKFNDAYIKNLNSQTNLNNLKANVPFPQAPVKPGATDLAPTAMNQSPWLQYGNLFS